MALGTRAWITAARARRRWRKPSREAWAQDRRRFIEQHAPGRSFADIGGLFGIHGDVAFQAEENGATEVTLFDAGDPTPEFFERREREGSGIRFVQGDLEDATALERVGPHDIVWCVGVIYHTPNPVEQLVKLRTITADLLYLGTHTVPELPGVSHGCVFYPRLEEADRQAYAAAHWRPERIWGIGMPFDDTPMLGHGNFWWGVSPSALRAMLSVACFEVVEERRPHAYPFYTEIVARPVDRHPSLPPTSYYRERAEARERGDEPPPFTDYYG